MQKTEGKSKKLSIEKLRKRGFGILNKIRSFTEEDKLKGQLEENN